jgi:hypothetical protein
MQGLARIITRVVEEEGVVGPGVLDEPMHGPQDVLLGGLAHGVLLVVGKDNHVLALVTKMLDQIRRHVPDIIDASSQLAALAKVVDADEQSFSPAGTHAILKGVVLRGSVAKGLGAGRRRDRSIVVV